MITGHSDIKLAIGALVIPSSLLKLFKIGDYVRKCQLSSAVLVFATRSHSINQDSKERPSFFSVNMTRI